MPLVRRLLTLLLLMPLLELIAFIAVAVAIGFWHAVLLSLATSLAGALLLKYAGHAQFHQVRHSIGTVELSSRSAIPVFAGLLLLIPGFITDAFAVLLLIPAFRRFLAGMVSSLMHAQTRPAGPQVVDLDPDEWRDAPKDAPPRRTLPHRPTDRPPSR
jgi:UPF0716 protein FxsA